jgi:hypothetical protein
MPVILVIDRMGSVKELSSKTYEEDKLYKKAGFKTATDFQMHHVFPVDMGSRTYRIRLYGKTKGKAGQENKYDFPPPVDNVLFFGSCLLVNVDADDCATHLSGVEWKQIYDKLFGGFEDLDSFGNEGDEDEDVSEEAGEDESLTKEGYVKDDFIVDDDEGSGGDGGDEVSEEEEESMEEVKPTKKSNIKKTPTKTEKVIKPDKAVKSEKSIKAVTTKRTPTAASSKSKPKTKRTVDTTYITSRSEEVLDTLPILQDELEEDEYFR